MSDIIQDALENWRDTTEREATGTINGHRVRLAKETYQMDQLGPTSWRVAVYIGGQGFPEEKEKDLEASEAQSLFDELRKKHGLTKTVK